MSIKGARTLTLSKHGKSYQLWTWPGKIQKAMLADVPYESELLEHIYDQGFTGVAVDGGANLGNHTMWFSVICGLDVVAFEPLHWRVLQQNVDLNRMHDRVRVEPVALTNDPEQVLTHVGKGRLIEADSPLTANQVLPLTLDSYGLTDVSLIKLDVEGMEPSALRGAEETILDQKPVLYTEVWGDNELKVIQDIVTPWGYQQAEVFQAEGSCTRMIEWKA